jgi:hypothetical protein
MRIRQLRALVVSILLTFVLSSMPVMAAPHHRDGDWIDRELPFIGRVIAKIKKTFGVTTNSDGLTLPTP